MKDKDIKYNEHVRLNAQVRLSDQRCVTIMNATQLFKRFGYQATNFISTTDFPPIVGVEISQKNMTKL